MPAPPRTPLGARSSLVALALLALTACGGAAGADKTAVADAATATTGPADVIWHGGTIVTVNDSQPTAQASPSGPRRT
ncbi:MAG: hypothetical protein MUE41_13410 [Gemmatimonadaceae bacterium]|nr:hypothetical protein [Gemmatimonadaceae bacterium]